MKKSVLICATLMMIANVGHADATKDFVTYNNIIFGGSRENMKNW